MRGQSGGDFLALDLNKDRFVGVDSVEYLQKVDAFVDWVEEEATWDVHEGCSGPTVQQNLDRVKKVDTQSVGKVGWACDDSFYRGLRLR